MNTTIDNLQKEAIKHGYTFNETTHNDFPWIKADVCFNLDGYKPNYDIRDDYGDEYVHNIYLIVGKICADVLGTPAEIHTTDMDKTRDAHWGTSFERWHTGNMEVVNYMYGHPKSGFFQTCLYIHKGKLSLSLNV